LSCLPAWDLVNFLLGLAWTMILQFIPYD
jgi:hypothetical protein